MKTDEILSKLRNAYGQNPKQMREIRLAAADEIEKWRDAYLNMKAFADSGGLDIVTYDDPPNQNPPA